MSKPTKQKRIKYETVYRVRWAAGNDADRFSKECAEDQVTQLAALGVEARVAILRRVEQRGIRRGAIWVGPER